MTKDSTDRDQITARIAARALRPPTAPRWGAVLDSACPDAELLAAYADHGLAAGEVKRWEIHFAGCPQCQNMLALLAISAEEDPFAAQLGPNTRPSLAGREISRVQQMHASASSPASAADEIQRLDDSNQYHGARPQKSKLLLVSVLAPLVATMGVAAALLLWLALRPVTTPAPIVAGIPAGATQSAPPANSPLANPVTSAAHSSPTISLKANSSAPTTQIAQAAIPQPPSATFSANQAGQSAKDLQQARQAQAKAAPTSALDSIASASPSQLSDKEQASQDQSATSAATVSPLPATSRNFQPALAAPQASQPVAGADRNSPAATANPGATAGAAPRASTQALVTVTTEIPVLETEKTEKAAQPASGQAAANNSSAGDKIEPTIPSPANPAIAGLAEPANPGFAFAAPNGTLWRVGPAGRIEHSNDKGDTWQRQSSGATADLLAGVAVSGRVAWAAGRSGIILRTTNGTTWQRIPPPSRLLLDWTSIHATDGQHATVGSSDGRSFRTENGGRTWTAQ